MIQSVNELRSTLGIAASCAVLGVPRASYYRSLEPSRVAGSHASMPEPTSPGKPRPTLAKPLEEPAVPHPQESLSTADRPQEELVVPPALVEPQREMATPQVPPAALAGLQEEEPDALQEPLPAPASRSLEEPAITQEPRLESTSDRALRPEERQQILDKLHSPRFVDCSPSEVFYTLLDEGEFIGSRRSFYRILAANDEVRERRAQRRHTDYKIG